MSLVLRRCATLREKRAKHLIHIRSVRQGCPQSSRLAGFRVFGVVLSMTAGVPYQIGLLFSLTGPYSIVARSMMNGALLALEEINASSDLGVSLAPISPDPGGNIQQYASMAEQMLTRGIKHVVGCYTSSSRKEIIPCFEKHDALLWYPSHYEGFESSANVVYTGAAPNQHIIPLIDWLVAEQGACAFCIGSNYIWAWENNRILRETVLARRGSVVAERYFPVGETDFAAVIDAIIAARPSFVFSTLIGTSAYQFFRDFRRRCIDAGIDQPRMMPVASCSLSEPELDEIGAEAVDGHISASVYFSSLKTAANASFIAAYQARFPEGPALSADAEASYLAIKLLGIALAKAGTDAVPEVIAAATSLELEAPQGRVRIDEDTLHTYLTPRIGRSTKAGQFEVLMEAAAPVRPDPYLVRNSPRFDVAPLPRSVRIVS
jgi:ABC-type branched-subunit amino acid transport system substrate-binding protein